MNVYNTHRKWSTLQFTKVKYVQIYKEKLKFCIHKAIHSQKDAHEYKDPQLHKINASVCWLL